VLERADEVLSQMRLFEAPSKFRDKLDYFLPLYMRTNPVWRDLFEVITGYLDGFLIKDDEAVEMESVYFLRRLFNVDLIPFEYMQSLARVFGWLLEVDYENRGEAGLRRQLDEMGRVFRDRLSFRTYRAKLYELGLRGTVHLLGTLDFKTFFPVDKWEGLAYTDRETFMDMSFLGSPSPVKSDSVILTPHIRLDIQVDAESGLVVDQDLIRRVRSRFESVRSVIMRLFLQFDFSVTVNNFAEKRVKNPDNVGVVESYDPVRRTLVVRASKPIKADALRFMWAKSVGNSFILFNTEAEKEGDEFLITVERFLEEPKWQSALVVYANNTEYYEPRRDGVYSRIVRGADLSPVNLVYFVDGIDGGGEVTREFSRLVNDGEIVLNRVLL